MTAPAPLEKPDPYASLRIPNYRKLVATLFTLTLAVLAGEVALSFQIYEITRDPLSLGMIGLAEAVPVVLTSLYAGHVVDRLARKPVAVVATLVLVLCAASLLGYTWLTPTVGRALWPFYAIIVASGFARSFLTPARTALAAELVPRELYANASTWRSTAWQLAAVIGPAIGGLVYGWASVHRSFGADSGPKAAYLVDVTLMLVALLSLSSILHTPGPRAPAGESVRESLGIGIRFVRSQPVILGALSLDLFSVLFGGATALLPVFADQILHVGPQGLGALRAAPAVGAVATSLILAHRRPFERTGRTLFVAVALFGALTIAFGLSRSFPLSLVLLAALGAADMVSVVIRSTLLQLMTPPHLQGRVSSVNQIFIGSSNEIGAFESGVAARWLGTVRAVVFGGMATLAVVAGIAARVPRLRDLRRMEESAA